MHIRQFGEMLLWGKYSFQVLVIMRVSAVMLGPLFFADSEPQKVSLAMLNHQ